jgi:hypothetical protein
MTLTAKRDTAIVQHADWNETLVSVMLAIDAQVVDGANG